eukprot:CFRG1353T1
MSSASRPMKQLSNVAKALKAAKPVANVNYAPFVRPKPLLYMPDIYVKLVRAGPTPNGVPRPKNVAMFHVPQTMTKFDIKNYLTDIYKMDIIKVHTVNQLGKTKRDQTSGKKFKRPDVKKAYVYLRDQEFEFPELYKATPPTPTLTPTPGAEPVDDAELKIQQAQANEMLI